MAKKAVALTNIKGGDVFVAEGEEIDLSKFSKDELKDLHAAGAIELVDQKDEKKSEESEESADEAGPDTEVKTGENGDPAKDTAPKTALGTTPAKATSAAAPAKTASPEVKKA